MSELVYVVMKESKGGEGRSVWVFSKHEDALRCRHEQKLDSHHLWGCTIDCYDQATKPISDLTCPGNINRQKLELWGGLVEQLKYARKCIAYCRRAHKDAQSGEGVPVEAFIDDLLTRAAAISAPTQGGESG